MAQLTTRTTSAPGATAKGSPLTNAEVDQNFNRLNKAGPQIRPSLLLDFANSESVDNRITFSRASAATYYDANGVLQTVRDNKPRIDFDPSTGECKGLLIEEQRTNLVLYSQRFDNTAWVKYRSTVLSNVIVAPNGTLTGCKLYEDSTASNTHFLIQNVPLGGSVDSSPYVFSIYAKAGERTVLQMYDNNSNTSGVTVFDLSAGTVVSGTGKISSAGNGWYRCSIYPLKDYTTSSTVYIQLHNGSSTTYTGNGSSGIYIWGAQLEAGSFATSYIPSTDTFTSRASSATYFDSTGVLRIAGTNQPRYGFGYDTTSDKWVSQGLVLEAAATNILVDSDLYGNTLASESIYTQTNNSTDVVAPNGSGLTTKLVSGTTGNTWYWRIPSAGTFTNGVTYTISVWVRCATGTTATWSLQPYPYNASTLCNVTDKWQRFSVTFTMTSATQPYIGFVSPMFNRTFYVWGWQAEVGSVATSYIPTFGSTATRAADVSSSAATTRGGDNAKLAGANFSSWWNNSAHSVFAEAMTAFTSNDYMIAEGANDSNQIVEMSLTFAGSASAKTQYINRLVSTANDMRSAASAYTANGFVKVAGAGSTSATLGSTSGVSNTSAGNQSSIRNANQMMIGSRQGGSLYLNGCIKKLAFFNKALSQNELNALTQ